MSSDRYGSWFRMCRPCSEVRHDDCLGADEWCECVAELLMESEDITRREAKEQTDGRDQR